MSPKLNYIQKHANSCFVVNDMLQLRTACSSLPCNIAAVFGIFFSCISWGKASPYATLHPRPLNFHISRPTLHLNNLHFTKTIKDFGNHTGKENKTFSQTSRITALVQVCGNPLVDRQIRGTSSKTFVPSNSQKISSNFVQLKSLHKFPKSHQSCSGQTKWHWMLQLFVTSKGDWVSPSSKHLTFFFHQVLESLPLYIIRDVADKDSISFIHIAIGFVTAATTSLLGPLLPARIRFMLGFPIHFSV